MNRASGLAGAIGMVLGVACAAACGLALLLAGRGALLLGDAPSARFLCGLLLLAGVGASLGFARALRPALALLGAPSEEEPVPRWLGLLLAAALLVFVAAAIAQALRAPDGSWDAWAIWNARARSLLRSAGDVRFACDARRAALFTMHPEYPLLLPTAVAAGWRLVGSETALVPALFSLVPALLCAAIAGLAVALEERRRGAWVLAILLTTPVLASAASSQYADAALAALVVAGAALLTLAWRLEGDGSPARGRLVLLAGVALGLSSSVKHEGALFLAAAALVVLLTRPRDLLPLALGAAAPLALFIWFSLAYAPPGDLAQAGPAALLHLALEPRRFGTLAVQVARRIVYVQAWGLHLVAFAVALGLALRRRELGRPARRLLLLCALVLGGFLAAFLTTPHDLEWHIRTSIDRLFLQLWPVAVLALGLQRVPARA